MQCLRAGCSGTCLGGLQTPEDRDPTASLCPVPVLILVSCHPTPGLSPTSPWASQNPPKCLWAITPGLFSHLGQAQLVGANGSPGRTPSAAALEPQERAVCPLSSSDARHAPAPHRHSFPKLGSLLGHPSPGWSHKRT